MQQRLLEWQELLVGVRHCTSTQPVPQPLPPFVNVHLRGATRHVGRSCTAVAPLLPLAARLELEGACIHERLCERQERPSPCPVLARVFGCQSDCAEWAHGLKCVCRGFVGRQRTFLTSLITNRFLEHRGLQGQAEAGHDCLLHTQRCAMNVRESSGGHNNTFAKWTTQQPFLGRCCLDSLLRELNWTNCTKDKWFYSDERFNAVIGCKQEASCR